MHTPPVVIRPSLYVDAEGRGSFLHMHEPKPGQRGRTTFDHFAERDSDVVSGAAFFAISLVVVVLWLPTIFVFETVDTWQLVINTVTSVLAFLLVALLQNSERRGDRAAREKLDVLSAAVADLLDLQLERGDREAIARRAAELREAIGIEERI
jgi:low affinity Fe/Cu permease